jgi:three-Cys-motif partner protein
MARDRWPELCEIVETDDGLPTRSVQHWTQDKLIFWNRYIHITTTAMVGNPAWRAGLIYVDLFGGPGICTLKETRKRIPGSPLIAAHAPKPFERIIVCEKDPELANACNIRLQTSPARKRFSVLEGDCNNLVESVGAMIPDRALTLAFIDPTGLHARFETIAALSGRGRVDLLLLFADAYDIQRNVEVYYQDPNSNLDQVLGPGSDWRAQWDGLDNRNSTNVRKMFADIYKNQLLRHLKYRVFGEHQMRSVRGALYRLIYASKHERGLDFWEKATHKDPGGQGRLF